MNTKLALLALLSIASLNAMDDGHKNACIALEPSNHRILPFDDERDTTEFLDLFNEERTTLVRRPHFSVDDMLFHNSIDYTNEATHGSLVIRVLRALNTENKMRLCGFVAYTVSADKKSYKGELLAVKKEDRKKDYAEFLVRHGVDEALAAGATNMWLTTLRTNEAAKATYKKIAAKYPNYELVEEPYNEKLKSLGLPENVHGTEAIALTLKLKQQR